jgi:hypothetical protein
MKKKGLFFILLISIIFFVSFISFISAANQTVSDKAYSCLESKVTTKCSSLNTEEKIFSLLAIQSCKAEVLSDSLASQCWPSSGCKIKTTSQAILALRNVNADTTTAERWLMAQNSSSSDLNWFLQVEPTSSNSTSCTATLPSGNSYIFDVNEDKTVDISSGGNCLSSYGGYWLQISPSCYNQDIKILCHDDFLSSLLYKKQTSATVFVSQKTDSAPAEGTTTETVKSYCFKEGSSCNYEGTLWAAFVLKYRGYDVSSYIPYLEAMAEENSQYLPDAFLYYLTGNFKNELAALQQQNQFWSASGDKFYDTAVALLPLQGQTTAEKTSAITWLGQVQGADGCWQGNIRNTAFLAYSIWPKQAAAPTAQDCEASGNHCMSAALCSSIPGNVLPDFTGCSVNVCCDQPIPLKSCSDLNGNLCPSGQVCSGSSVDSSDGACCKGTCQTQQAQTETCASQGSGTCRSSCLSSEDTSYSYTCSSSLSCCIEKPAPNTSWIIIVLIILIVLVLIGILFRKKLRTFFLKFKSGKGKPKPMTGGPRFPPTSSQRPYPPMQRRILQPVQRAPVRRPVAEGKSDFDEVLKKLKEIGK